MEGASMAARREKTRTPGIYRRGSRYVFCFKVDGRQKWESARTLDEARRLKAARTADIARGEFEERSRVKLHDYAREWVERYQGKGRRGFRENTRHEYRRVLQRDILPYFPPSMKLTEMTPSKVSAFVAHLCKQTRPAATKDDSKRRVPVSDSTIRNIMAPLRACLGDAVREGLIRSNPSRETDLPHRPTVESDEEVRALSAAELTTLLGTFPESWRLFFRFLAATGLRFSEAIALQWRHLQLDGPTPQVQVRRSLVRGRMEPPKSRYSRREVPIDQALVLMLRKHRNGAGEDDLVFAAGNGSPINYSNTLGRVLKPSVDRAGLPWVRFHTFRHTCATMLFAQGRNAVQVQHWLGHHSAAFTLSTYVHLLDGDIGEALSLPGVVTQVVTGPTAASDNGDRPIELEAAA